MIFRIRNEQGESLSHYYSVRKESMKQFIRLVLGFYIDRRIQMYDLKSTYKDRRDVEFRDRERELTEWERETIPRNAKNVLESYFQKAIRNAQVAGVANPITYEDLTYCMEKFLSEEGIAKGTKSFELSFTLKKLEEFNPEAGSNKDKSEIYNNYAKKIGLIFLGFTYYLKSNLEDLKEMKNNTSNLLMEYETDEGSDSGGNRRRHKGIRENLIGEEMELNFDSIVNITKEVYSYFFEHEKDKKKAKINLVKLYNIYLDADIRFRNNNTHSYIIGKTLPLTPEEIDSLDELVDETYPADRDIISDEIAVELNQILSGSDMDKQRVLSDFFALLVKAGYKLKVYENPYFNNLDSFRYSNITCLKDFIEAMERTTIMRDEYSEFPLLQDYTLNEVVRYNKMKADKTVFKNSVSQVPTNPSEVAISKVEHLDRRLAVFLEKIIELEKQAPIHPKLGMVVDTEVVRGINRDTIKAEDIRLAMKVLGKFENNVSLKQNLVQFGGICDLMLFNVKSNKLNYKEPPELLEKFMYRFIVGNTHLGGIEYRNRERLENLWRMLREVSKHLLALEAKEMAIGSITYWNNENSNRRTMYGVPYWELRDVKIPLVERTMQYFFVKVFGVPVRIHSKDLSVGRFHYEGQEYEATTKGVDLLYRKEMMKYMQETGENFEGLLGDEYRDLGVDIDIDSSLIGDSIMKWASRKKNKVKETPTKKPEENTSLDGEDLFKDLGEVFDSNLDTFF